MNTISTYPQPQRPNNPTPFEMALYNYELKAKKFFDDKKKSKCLSKDKLNRDFNHLERERKRLESLLAAQKSLDIYRAQCEGSTVGVLKKEHHHPTEKLAKYLRAEGEPQPTEFHEAHHIICGAGRFAEAIMTLARIRLHSHGIGINDPRNGAWLRNFERNKPDDWATPETISHRRLHRYNYELWVGRNLSTKDQKEEFLKTLKIIKIKIKNNLMPANVSMAKDVKWDGREL